MDLSTESRLTILPKMITKDLGLVHVYRKSHQDELAAKFLITDSYGPLRRDIMSKT